MCCCEHPNVNGQPGYRWQPTDPPSVRPVDPPELNEHDVLLYDEPGRCGGTDAHSHHYRVVLATGGRLELLVKHGGGQERLNISLWKQQRDVLRKLDSDARFWFLNAIHHAHYDGAADARQKEAWRWTKAAKEKRIKTRKLRSGVKVWIEEANHLTRSPDLG